MSRLRITGASSRFSMLLDNHRIVPQPPPQIATKTLRPAAVVRRHTRVSTALVRPVDAAESASMERRALLAALLKLSPSRRRCAAPVCSIALRPVSHFCCSRSAKSLRVEVLLVQRSLQPPPLPALRVVGGHVALALARPRRVPLPSTRPRRRRGHERRRARRAARGSPESNSRGSGLDLQSGPQLRRVDAGTMAGLLRPGPRRVVGPAPAVLVVEGVAQRAEGLLPARRRDVEAPARSPGRTGRREDVHVDAAAALAVLDGPPTRSGPVRVRPTPSARTCRARPRSARRAAGPPGAHAMTPEGVLGARTRARRRRRPRRRDPPRRTSTPSRSFPGRVPLAEQVVGRRPGRTGPAGDELNVHRQAPGRHGRACRASARCAASRRSSRWRPSARRGCSPTRAIWFRLLPTRGDLPGALALDLGRRRGPGAGSRHLACRSRREGDTPAASALACQAACSSGVTRAATMTVRRSATAHRHGGSGGTVPERPGVRRGAQHPLASLNVQH